MNPFEMTVLIVLIVTVGRVLSGGRFAARRAARRGQRAEPADGLVMEENAALKAELARLNERLAVLERIATDPGRRLSDEIDSLKSRS